MATVLPLVSFLLFALSRVACAVEFFSPLQTLVALDAPDVLGWTPLPTAAPYFYAKRQDTTVQETCGYISGNRCTYIPVPYAGACLSIPISFPSTC